MTENLMRVNPIEERVVVAEDLNDHVGVDNRDIKKIHGGHRYGGVNVVRI